ncbi:unnamed protein product [Pleuronectes platessa]|uniref:Somatotropin n=1 Tax=Pleuronectes platessa TaxID=8262 RepID=A0A9N7YH20_PLEPL|nr:unnamed protein product [Pleuronectes platessa]
MNRVILLLSVMCVGVSSQPITENQRLFSIAVGRVQYLHLVAKKLFSDFVLKLLSISYRLIESWEFSSRFLVAGFAVRTQVTSKLSELKTGLMKLIEANQDGASGFSESSVIQLTPYGNYYQSVGVDESFRRNYELFACFKKDMHKVETYLTVAKCRLSPEANCTL